MVTYRREDLAPVFIVAPPRAGAKLLFSVLSQVDGCYFRDDHAPDSADQVPELHPSAREWRSGRLDRLDVARLADGVVDRLVSSMLTGARDRADVALPEDLSVVPLLDASARHAMRVPFLAEVFPRARFVLMLRRAAPSVASLTEAWQAVVLCRTQDCRTGPVLPRGRTRWWRGGGSLPIELCTRSPRSSGSGSRICCWMTSTSWTRPGGPRRASKP
jgi:hypothetical protein